METDVLSAGGPKSPVHDSKSLFARWVAHWNVTLTLLPALAVAVMSWRHRALTDDGTIFLRTVRQILAGNGPVLNIDERVEANTSTLWQWLLVLLGAAFPGDLGFIAVTTGVLLTTAGVFIACDATRRLYTSKRPGLWTVPAGMFVLCAVPPFWDFASGGLDSGLGTFWLSVCWWLLVRSRSAPGARERTIHAFVYGLGVLVRPDLFIVTAVFFCAALILHRPSWRQTAAQLAALAALPLAYEIFRAGYYGLLTPMPALTKEAGQTELGTGLRYLRDFAVPYALYVPAALLLLAAFAVARYRPIRRSLIVPATPVIAATAMTAYIVKVGGDYMHARMLLPAMYLALLPALLLPATRRLVPVAAMIGIWAVAVIGPWHPAAYHSTSSSTTRVRDDDIGLTDVHNPDHTRDWTAAFPGLKDSLSAADAAGVPVLLRLRPFDFGPDLLMPLNPAYKGIRVSVPGWYLGVTGETVPLDQRIVEMWGLANTLGAHLEYTPGWDTKLPGHRKLIDDVWLLALELDPRIADPPPGAIAVTRENLAAARHALSCGDLKRLLDSTREPLTAGRFLDNLLGAWGRTNLRIPRDPFVAERRYCDR
jgi:arabinofuranosyltransferase